MVPRESGIGNPELRRPDRTYHECCRGSISICTHNKALTSADITPPSTSIASPSLESMEKEEEVTSHV